MMNSGMSACIGTEAKPSIALLDQHIWYLDTSLEQRFREATTVDAKVEIARAALVNLITWLGWLRANETLSITFEDLEISLPGDSARHDLPDVVGLILICLLDQKKSDRTRAADLPLP